MSDDQKPLCRACGAELTGKDVYEGMCKACREEAILGSSPEKQVEARPRPRRDKPAVEVPEGAIALETDVDVEADTRELGVKAEAPPEPVAAAPRPEHRPAPEPASEEAARTRSPFSLIPEVGDGPAIPLAPTDDETTTKPTPKDASPDVGNSEVGFLEPRLVPEAPEPPAQPPPEARGEVATAPPPPPAVTEEPEPVAEKAPAPEPRPEPSAASRTQTPRLALDIEGQLAQLRPLLVELSAEVRSVRESLGRAQASQPRPIAFGFKAFFGFLLAFGLTALVALGIMALLGATVYPPALETLRRILRAVTGG